MKFFKNDKELERKVIYLEEERVKLWGRLTLMEGQYKELEKSISRSPAQSAREASKYRNRAEKTSLAASEILESISEKGVKISVFLDSITERKTKSEEVLDEVLVMKKEVNTASQSVLDIASKLDQLEEDHPDLESEISELEEHMATMEELNTKISNTHKGIITRKAEIDKIYYAVLGHMETDEDGEEVPVEGLKDELEKAYDALRSQANEIEGVYDTKLEAVSEDYTAQVKKWNEEHGTWVDKIKKLLPDALTAGLSGAYAEKRKDEEEALDKHVKSFSGAIQGMCFISFIPIIVNLFLLVNGGFLKDILVQTPQMLFVILPLYVPVLWIAYTSNKRANLSKRLIEEYTHKEVMNKTYQGLSEQVNGLGESETTEMLRNQLLVNMLEVSGENPGKLISDYNNADHPLMDALDKSLQMSKAFDKLEKVPGLATVSKILNRKAQFELDAKAQKIKIAVVSNDSSDSDEPESMA